MKNVTNILLIAALGISLYLLADKLMGSSSKKIGVVQMDKLVYEFKGMKDATEKYTKKMAGWQAQTDSLEKKLKQMYDQVRIDSVNNDQQKLNKDIQLFMIFKQSYIEYAQNIQQKAADDDKQMTVGVINQINEYMKSYATEEGYDMILCNNNQYQNVGFAKEQIDITKQMLEYANKKYDGTK